MPPSSRVGAMPSPTVTDLLAGVHPARSLGGVRQPRPWWVVQAAGAFYLTLSLGSLLYYSSVLTLYCQNDYLWTEFNASGTQTFVADAFNSRLWNTVGTSTALPLFDMAIQKSYSSPTTPIYTLQTDARRIVMEQIAQLDTIVTTMRAHQSHVLFRTLVTLCWVDFNKHFEVATTAKRQQRCLANFRHDAAVYLEPLVRNSDYAVWRPVIGQGFDVAIGAAINKTEYGRLWFATSIAAFGQLSDADEVAYWRRNNITRFVVPWYNAYSTGLHETITIINAFQAFVLPVKSVPTQGSSVWTTIVASVGMNNLFSYAESLNVSLVRSDPNHFGNYRVPDPERFGGSFPNALESIIFHQFLGPLTAVDLNYVLPPPSLVALYDRIASALIRSLESDDDMYQMYRSLPASAVFSAVPRAWMIDKSIKYFWGGNPLCMNGNPDVYVMQQFAYDDDCATPRRPLVTPGLPAHVVLVKILTDLQFSPTAVCARDSVLTGPCHTTIHHADALAAYCANASASCHAIHADQGVLAETIADIAAVNVQVMQYVTTVDRKWRIATSPLLVDGDPAWTFAGWLALLDWVQGSREVIAFEGDVTTLVLMSRQYEARPDIADPRQIPTRFSQLVFGVAWYINGIMLAVLVLVLGRWLVWRTEFPGRNAFYFPPVLGVVWIGRPLVFVRGLLALSILSTAPLSLETRHGFTRLVVLRRSMWEIAVLAYESVWVTYALHDVTSLWTTSRTLQCTTMSAVVVWVTSVVIESTAPFQPSATMARTCKSQAMDISMECDAGTVWIGSPGRFWCFCAIQAGCLVASNMYAYVMKRLRHDDATYDVPVVIPAMAYYLMAPSPSNPDSFFDPVSSVIAGLVPFHYKAKEYIFNVLIWLVIPLRESVDTAFAFRRPTHLVRPSLKPRSSLTSSRPQRSHRNLALRSWLGVGYLVCTAASSALFFYVSDDKFSNGFLWENFNSSGMHVFLTIMFNGMLTLDTNHVVDISSPASSVLRSVNASMALAEFSSLYPHRMQFEHVSVQSVVEGLRRTDACMVPWIATQYCYVDFGRQWEMANSEHRQERCRRHMTDNGAVYLESVFRNVQWSQLDQCWGSAIQVGINAELELSASGRDWLAATRSVTTTPLEEVAFWTRYKITRYVVQWQNYKRLGIHETFDVENAFGLVNKLSLKASSGTFANTVGTSKKMYWGWGSDLWAIQSNETNIGGLSLIRSSSKFAFANHSLEEVLTGYRQVIWPLDEGLALTRQVVGPFGSVDMRHVPCPKALLQLINETMSVQNQAVKNMTDRSIEVARVNVRIAPVAWTRRPMRGGNPLCGTMSGGMSSALLQFFGTNVNCGSVFGEVISPKVATTVVGLAVSGLHNRSMAASAKNFAQSICSRVVGDAGQCAALISSAYNQIVLHIPQPTLTAFQTSVRQVQEEINAMHIETMQYIGVPSELVRAPFFDPNDPAWSFFAWVYMFDWATDAREVVTFEGDAGSLTLMSNIATAYAFQLNPLEIPTHFAYYCRLCIQYTTVVLFVVTLWTGLYAVASRGRIEGINMLEVNRVAGIVWVGRPLLLLRSMSAMCLLATASLSLVQNANGITRLVGRETSNIAFVMLSATETYWFVIVWSDLFMLATRDHTTKYSAYSGGLIWLVTVVLSFASPVEPLVVVHRSCTADQVDFQLTCSGGFVRIGHVKRLVTLCTVTLMVVLLCFVWERWRHKSFRLPHHTTSLLLPAGAFYLYNKGPWIFDDTLYLDTASAFMCGLLSVRWQGRIYLLDIKTWRTFVFVIDDDFDAALLADNVYDQERIKSAIPMIE